MLKDKEIRKQVLIYSTSGIVIAIAILLLLNIDALVNIIKNLLNVLSPFLWGIAIAFITSKFADIYERLLPKKLSFNTRRFISSLASVIILILIIVVFALIISPQLGESIASLSTVIVNFTENAPTWIKSSSKNSIIPSDVVEVIYEYSNTLISSIWAFIKTSVPNLVNFTINTVSGVLNFVIGFIVALYILLDRDNIITKLRKFTKAFVSEKMYKELTIIYNVAISRFYRFFKGKLLDSLIIGILCFIVMCLLNLDYAILISFIVCITNIIPFFGPFIGAIPSALILLMVDPGQCLEFIILIIVLQQVDGNIIGPRILGDSVGLSSLWIMFAIIVGGAYFGFFGMLFGVPVFSVIYFLITREVNNRLNKEDKKMNKK